ILYGLWPSAEVKQTIALTPAMRLQAQVVHVKEVPVGTGISYGRTYRAAMPRSIATLPIGYADGWMRLLSGKACVMIRGQRAPLVGRICMDQCMVDISDIAGVNVGDTATLFGRPGLTADEVAGILGTINYELVCMIGKRVPRIYMNT
ncbi:MAG: alr1, partial [Sporomusa sp.]|nr:alr1 [Sporomusa sp.]